MEEGRNAMHWRQNERNMDTAPKRQYLRYYFAVLKKKEIFRPRRFVKKFLSLSSVLIPLRVSLPCASTDIFKLYIVHHNILYNKYYVL
jgi:hypothetical protein